MSLANALIIVCKHVLEGHREIDAVVHHSDDTWQVTCGKPDHETDDDAEVVHAGHLFDDHDWLEDMVRTIDKGYLADRTDSGWKIMAHDD